MHEQADGKDLQREIDDLKKRLRRAQRKRTLPTLTFLPMMTKMLVTKNAQKLHLVSLILVRRNILAKGGEGVHLEGG